jgi:hypothetical protein
MLVLYSFRYNSNPLFTLIKRKSNYPHINKEMQMGSVAKSYMMKGFLIYEKMRKYLNIHEEAHLGICNRFLLNFLIYI